MNVDATPHRGLCMCEYVWVWVWEAEPKICADGEVHGCVVSFGVYLSIFTTPHDLTLLTCCAHARTKINALTCAVHQNGESPYLLEVLLDAAPSVTDHSLLRNFPQTVRDVQRPIQRPS